MPNKIEGYKVSPVYAPSAKTAKQGPVTPSEARTGDQVTLTDSARSLQKIEEVLANTPVVDSAKVDAVKQALNQGTYKIDSGSIADKILTLEGALK